MTLTFTVREPMSVNAMYGSNKKTKRRFLTHEGKLFKNRIVIAATLARATSLWPRDPFRVAKARLSYQLFNYKGDTDGPRKALRDALERVLYMNDRCVEDGPAPFALRDEGERRVVVTLDLLEARTDAQAYRERVRHTERMARNLKRRATIARKKLQRAS